MEQYNSQEYTECSFITKVTFQTGEGRIHSLDRPGANNCVGKKKNNILFLPRFWDKYEFQMALREKYKKLLQEKTDHSCTLEMGKGFLSTTLRQLPRRKRLIDLTA